MGRWTRVAAVVLSMLGVGVFAAPAATAATGDLVATVPLPEATQGVSIAFDGQYLWYTNEGEAVLHRITPSGVPGPDVPINGGTTDIDALSYDATRDAFWGAGGTNADYETIYLITKAGVATPAFTVSTQVTTYRNCDNLNAFSGCVPPVDGISYDATNDTVWYSPDQSSRVYEFDANEPNNLSGLTGYLVGFFDVNDGTGNFGVAPACQGFQTQFGTTVDADFNSGVAVSGGNVYLGAPDCAPPQIFQYSRSPLYCPNDGTFPSTLGCAQPTQCRDPEPVGSEPTLATDCPGNEIFNFTYGGTRPEDDECDNVTFNVDVIWVRDELDPVARAYEVPAGSCIFGGGVMVQPTQSRMTGGGYLAGTNGNAYQGFMIHCDPTEQPNRLQVSWANGMHFHMTSLTTSSCGKTTVPPSSVNNQITGSGTGRLNGVNGATVQFQFADNGEPGTMDNGTITINGPGCAPCTWTGPLLGGNYQMHNAS